MKAIAYTEAIVQPRSWQDFPDTRREVFQRLRSDEGERLALEENFFVETILPKSIIRSLRQEEMDAYRRPFPDPRSRLPTLVFPRELPIEGEPADVVEAVERYGAWLASSTISKLFVSAEPGALLIGPSSAAAGRTKSRSASTASTSSRKTQPMRSAQRCASSCNRSDRSLEQTAGSSPTGTATTHCRFRWPQAGGEAGDPARLRRAGASTRLGSDRRHAGLIGG